MKKLFIIALTGLLSVSVFANAQSNTPQVIVQSVKAQPMSRQVEALGTLRANESIRLTSHTTKTVTQINFNDGERVEAGQILVEMTSAEELALLEEARTNTDESRKQLDRVRSLAAQGAASQSLLDERVREHESAKA